MNPLLLLQRISQSNINFFVSMNSKCLILVIHACSRDSLEASATMISKVIGELLDKGTTLVTTSNLSPSDVCTKGLHFQRFTPFAQKLEQKLQVILNECGIIMIDNSNRYGKRLQNDQVTTKCSWN